MFSGHQRITWRRNIAENFNRLSRVHERYRQTTDDRQTTDRRLTDGRTTTYSEHEHEFRFAKNRVYTYRQPKSGFSVLKNPGLPGFSVSAKPRLESGLETLVIRRKRFLVFTRYLLMSILLSQTANVIGCYRPMKKGDRKSSCLKCKK